MRSDNVWEHVEEPLIDFVRRHPWVSLGVVVVTTGLLRLIGGG